MLHTPWDWGGKTRNTAPLAPEPQGNQERAKKEKKEAPICCKEGSPAMPALN